MLLCRADLFMKRDRLLNCLKWTFFIIYLCILFYVVFFAESMGRAETASGYKYNFHPFSEIERYWVYLGHTDILGKMAALNIIGNIIAFVPFGLFLPWLTKNNFRFISTFFYSFTLSLIIESVQLIFRVGCFDVDDLILNTMGGIIGYILYIIMKNVNLLIRKSSKHEIV